MTEMDKTRQKDPKDLLREKAEALFRKRGVVDDALYSKSLEELIEELQIYQFELEHQNQELKRVSEELAQSLEKYEDLYHQAPAVFITLDEDDVIRQCNQTFCRILSLEASEIKGEALSRFLHPESQDEFYLAMRKLEKGTEVTGLTLRLKSESQDTELFLRGNISRSEEQGIRLNMLPATREVRHERYLKFQTLILENISDFITATDIHGKITWVSEAVCRLFGKKPSELIGKTTRDFGENAEKGATQEEILKETLERGEWNGEVVNVLPGGREIIMKCRTRLLKDESGVTYGMVGISTDITELKEKEEYLRAKNREYAALTEEYESQNEHLVKVNKELRQTTGELKASEKINTKHRRKLEQQNKELKRISKELNQAKARAEESDQLKSAFLGNMSHELRTPLNAIIGFSSLMDENTNPEDLVRFRDIIYRNGKDLLEIIENSLDLSLIESGQMRLILSEFSVTDLIEELSTDVAHMRLHHQKEHLEIQHSGTVSGISGSLIRTDRGKLKQIIKNLIGNAIKYTESGFISWEVLLTDQQFICVVKDSGVGIAKDRQEIIFDRFRIADETTTRKYGGAGLGLAISDQMAVLMGGEISLQSEKGKGSTFSLTIPRYLESAEQAMLMTDIQNKKKNFSPDWQSKLALVVDDDPEFLKILKRVLQSTGMQVLCASHGKEALELLQRQQKTDIILMDIAMPEMNGIEATRRIRELSTKIPVLAVTAHTEKLVLDEVINAGYTDYVLKPIQHKELIRKMASYIM